MYNQGVSRCRGGQAHPILEVSSMTPLDSSYREIPLTQGQVALVDAADYEWLMQWKWFAHWSPGTRSFYACRNSKRIDGQRYHIGMHREILGLPKSDKHHGEHRDPYRTLDNRRQNLRVDTATENAQNHKRHRNNTSGFKGVQRIGERSYAARIGIKGKLIYLGTRDTAEQAHDLYRKAAEQHFGEFARFE